MKREEILRARKVGQIQITVSRVNPSDEKYAAWNEFLEDLLDYFEDCMRDATIEYPEEAEVD